MESLNDQIMKLFHQLDAEKKELAIMIAETMIQADQEDSASVDL